MVLTSSQTGPTRPTLRPADATVQERSSALLSLFIKTQLDKNELRVNIISNDRSVKKYVTAMSSRELKGVKLAL